MRVYAATHEHRHGTTIRVFKSEASAWEWRRDIADQWWDYEITQNDIDRPKDREAAANAYFDYMNDEYFNVEGCELEN